MLNSNLKIDISRKTAVICVAVLMLCAGVFAGFRLVYDEPQPRDGCLYMLMARNWSGLALERDAIFDSHVPPGLIVILRVFIALGIDPEKGGVIFNVCCGMLLVAAVYWLAAVFFEERKYALCAAFLCAFHPMLLRQGSDVLREPGFILFYTLSFGCMIMMLRRNAWRWRYFALVFAMAAMLFRMEGLELLGFYFLATFLKKRDLNAGDTWRRWAIEWTMPLIALLLMLGLQLWWNSYGMNWQVIPLQRLLQAFGIRI